MLHTHLLEAAGRMRYIAEGLNNPTDRAIAATYADDLAHLAQCEVTEPTAIPLKTRKDQAVLEGMSGILTKVYQPDALPFCGDLLLVLVAS